MRSESKGRGTTVIGSRSFVWGSKTYVMGVVNVTPDSFSGDGIGGNVSRAVELARRFSEWGADIIDVGGESTRPPSVYAGSEPVSADDELARVLPIIGELVEQLDIPISIDTHKASVAEAALDAGATMINDVWGMSRDPAMAGLAASHGVPVVLMHNSEAGGYGDVVAEVIAALADLRDSAVGAGVEPDNIVLDPGIGFGGKGPEHNLEILRRLREFEFLGQPLLVGTSRKSTIGYVLDLPVGDRVEGTAATVALSIAGGADIVRVHDVREMVRVARMSDAIVRGWTRS